MRVGGASYGCGRGHGLHVNVGQFGWVGVVSVKESARWRGLVNISCTCVWLDVDVGGKARQQANSCCAALKERGYSTRLALIGHLRPHLIGS